MLQKNLEKRLARLLASVNTETKNIMLAFCIDAKPKSLSEILQKFNDLVHELPLKNPHSTFYSYLNKSLKPSKLIDAEGKKPTKYKLSQEGEEYGKKLASFTIEWAVDNNLSIQTILGPAHSSGNSRSPYNRFRILEQLVNHQTLRSVDLIHALGINSNNLRRHLMQLKRAGLINFESADTETKGWAQYSFAYGKDTAKIKPVKNLTKVMKLVAQELEEKKRSMDYNELAKYVPFHKSTLSCALAALERQNIVTATFRGGQELSKIALIQKRKIQEYVNAVREFMVSQEGPVNNSWKNLSSSKKQKYYSQKGTDLYYSVSSSIKKKSRKEHKKEIQEILKLHGELRPRQVAEFASSGLELSCLYLREMYKSGIIKQRQKGRAVYYTLIN